MKFVIAQIILAFIISLSIVSCDAPTPVPTTNLPLTAAAQAADDIVDTPGGMAYRANVQQQGVQDTWAPVATVTKEISGVTIRYRASIETKAGESRNNIIHVALPTDRTGKDNTLDFYSNGLPEGISVAVARNFSSPSSLEAGFVFTIAPTVTHGNYSFEIGIKLNRMDLGTVPCVITVIG